MKFTTTEKIKILLTKRKMTATQLAEKLGISRQNLSNKMNRDDFSTSDLIEIANALDCTYSYSFTMNDTGESI